MKPEDDITGKTGYFYTVLKDVPVCGLDQEPHGRWDFFRRPIIKGFEGSAFLEEHSLYLPSNCEL